MPLSLSELQKAQAEVEGFQQGPTPALNGANLNTQYTLGNPQTPSTSPAPYYPSKETPNLKMSTRDMSSELANNFFIAYNSVTGVFSVAQPAFTDISGNLAMGQIPTGGSGSTYLRGDGAWATPAAGAASTIRLAPIDITTAAYAINQHTPATYRVMTVAVNAMTLPAPTVTTDDGVVIQITLGTSAAHTLTLGSTSLRCGTAAVTTVNFASYYGASIMLMADQGLWYVMAANNVTYA